jgi:hypothetical protein
VVNGAHKVYLSEIAKAPKNYWVAEKSDGTRFLMLINKEGAYLVLSLSLSLSDAERALRIDAVCVLRAD